jgi:hypothetical protein
MIRSRLSWKRVSLKPSVLIRAFHTASVFRRGDLMGQLTRKIYYKRECAQAGPQAFRIAN